MSGAAVLTFGGTALTSTSAGALCGFPVLEEGVARTSIERREPLRSNGVIEVWQGDREATHRVTVTYYTSSEDTLKATVGAFKDRTYRTMACGGRSLPYCRLADIKWSAHQYGQRGGSDVYRIEATLEFVQVRQS